MKYYSLNNPGIIYYGIKHKTGPKLSPNLQAYYLKKLQFPDILGKHDC
jgi:hypothetical protein